MYTEDTIITYGKYKFKKIKDIPAQYLIKLHENGCHDKEMMTYLQANIGSIRAKFLNMPFAVDIVTFKCPKLTFPTKKAAKDCIDAARKRGSQTTKKPIRAYECKNCSGWHLTSKTYEEYTQAKEKAVIKK